MLFGHRSTVRAFATNSYRFLRCELHLTENTTHVLFLMAL